MLSLLVKMELPSVSLLLCPAEVVWVPKNKGTVLRQKSTPNLALMAVYRLLIVTLLSTMPLWKLLMTPSNRLHLQRFHRHYRTTSGRLPIRATPMNEKRDNATL